MASSFTLERRIYSFPKENVFVLKRKNFDDSEKQSHTGRNVALGLLGTAALGAGGFAMARRGHFGGAAQMTTNKWWNKLGQRFNNEGMITSSIEKHAQGFEAAAKKNSAKYADTTAAKMAEEAGMAKNLEHAEQLKAAKKAEGAAKASEGAAATQNATQAAQPPATIAAPATSTGAAASTTSASADPFANFPLPKHTSTASVPSAPPSSVVAPKQGFWERTMNRVRGKINGAKEARQARKNARKMSDLANAVPAHLNPANGTFLRGTAVERVAAPAPSIMTTPTPPPIPKALDPTLAAQARQSYTGGLTSFQLPRVTEAVPRGRSPLDNSLVQSMREQAGMGAPNPQYTQTWNLGAIQG